MTITTLLAAFSGAVERRNGKACCATTAEFMASVIVRESGRSRTPRHIDL